MPYEPTPYCDVPAVQSLRPQHAITSTSRPNESQVQEVIRNVSGRVDGHLKGLGFLVPVPGTAPQARAWLRTWVAFGVACMIESGQVAGLDDATPTAPENRYCSIFDAMLAALIDNPLILGDAPKDAGQGATGYPIASFFTKYPEDDPATGQLGKLGVTAKPRFSMRQEF